MDLNDAVKKHAEWKIKLRSAISKHEQMDVVTLAKDNCCELGEWLHGEGRVKFNKLESHGECIQKHAAFHVEVAKIATAVNAKKFTAAEAMLGPGTAYAHISSALSVAFIRLRKEAGL
jgi:NOL1/NOP2/fmu family ribosome biogenesis protein